MKLVSRAAFVFTCLVLLHAAILANCASAAEPQKLAFLVGVSKYDKAGLRDLHYPEADMRELGDELTKDGFKVKIMLGSGAGDQRATVDNLQQQLLKNFILKTKKLNKSDVVLVAFAGHGVQRLVGKNGKPDEDAFFCPVDCSINATGNDSLISLGDLMDSLAANSGSENNLLVVDACRDDPSRGGRGIDGSKVTSLPGNMACLFGASSGTQSYESDKIKHGLLTYYFLQGLRGKAKDDDNEVNWDSLVGYTKKEVSKNAPVLVNVEQIPNSISNIKGSPPVLARIGLASIAPTRVETLPETPAPELLRAPFDRDAARGAQQSWAAHLHRQVVETNSIGMKLALVPPGEFMMGSNEDPDALLKYVKELNPDTYKDAVRDWFSRENPAHRVRITRPFYLGIYTIRLRDFREFVADEGYQTEAEKDGKGGRGYDPDAETVFSQAEKFNWRRTGWDQSDDHPVVNVTWNDAQAFCHWLSKKEGKTYRLPTEAEWEYACRAGTETRFYNGDDFQKLTEVGNVADATCKAKFSGFKIDITTSDGYVFTAPVGQFRPNAFGLYDMHGNVYQWCQDRYDKDYYANSPTDDPQGPSAGSSRVFRGGSWYSDAVVCRSANRCNDEPANRDVNVGFRVVCER